MSRPEGLLNDLFGRPTEEGRSLAVVISKDGRVIAERYGTQPANDFQDAVAIEPDTPLISWSMAKSITHAAVGLLAFDGRLDVDARAPVVEWQGTAKEAITVLQLLEMRSGLAFVEDYVDGEVSNCIEMLFGESGPSHAAYAATLPLEHVPGDHWNYSSGTSNILARIIGDVVAGSGTTGDDRRRRVDEFLHTRLFGPTGMDSATPRFDGAGDFVGSSYVFATARDFARFGELYRHDGITAGGERILPEGWRDHARTQIATDPETGFGYGRHWWIWPDFPGSLACHGYEGQFTLVWPDAGVVLVHLGKTPAEVAPQLVARLTALAHAIP